MQSVAGENAGLGLVVGLEGMQEVSEIAHKHLFVFAFFYLRGERVAFMGSQNTRQNNKKL